MEGMSEAIGSVQECARLGLGFSVDGGLLTSTFFWRRSGLRREELSRAAGVWAVRQYQLELRGAARPAQGGARRGAGWGVAILPVAFNIRRVEFERALPPPPPTSRELQLQWMEQVPGEGEH